MHNVYARINDQSLDDPQALVGFNAQAGFLVLNYMLESHRDQGSAGFSV